MSRLLKSLELNGFKSFGERTVLELPEGITAIVGPNGSGKSNVIDAIRWLLGEREARNLRGSKSEDLIFAGTKERPRMGLGQASLQFSNVNNFFPVDFEDIIVTRQASRDGSNQYFINKSEVRLKDLIDFFAHSRLGARGLVVITQGNSDMFIRATPQERRAMIEEILGLREFQLKKNEAERRLENAEINLEKVKALVEEILPHLRSLKRQTARWEKRGSIEEELKNLENQFFSAQLQALRKEEKKLVDVSEDRHKEKAHLEAEQKKAEEKLQKTEAREPEERKRLEEVKKRIQALLEDRSKLQKELGRIEAHLEVREEATHEISVSHKDLLDTVTTLKTHLEKGLHSDFETLKSVVEEALSKIDSLFTSPKRAESPHSNLDEDFKKLEKQLTALSEDLGALEKEERALEQGQSDFYGAFKAAVSELEAVKNKIQSWERSNQSLFLEQERLKLHEEELKRHIEQAGRTLHEFEKMAEINDINLPELDRRILKLRGDLASIGEIDEALVKEAAETEERYTFLERESADLEKSKADLRALILELRQKIKTDFEKALVKINKEFATFFDLMFGGGQGKLTVLKREKRKEKKDELEEGDEEAAAVEPETVEDSRNDEGVEVEVKLPRKRITSLEMLSGGERSLVGIAALFALISVSPPPFLVLDEIDAPLDERNARRFAELVKKFAHQTQFVIVTHNRATMEAANVLYGVTMNQDGTSKVVSLKLETITTPPQTSPA
jgi:chromosome segregation ATPase